MNDYNFTRKMQHSKIPQLDEITDDVKIPHPGKQFFCSICKYATIFKTNFSAAFVIFCMLILSFFLGFQSANAFRKSDSDHEKNSDVEFLSLDVKTTKINQTPKVNLTKAELNHTAMLVPTTISASFSPTVQHYLDLLRQHKLVSSHQQKLFTREYELKNIDFMDMKDAEVDRYFGTILNKRFAYLHIWKSGGTTVVAQSPNWQVSKYNVELQSRTWFTFVRDPISHFFSGWQECEYRKYYGAEPVDRNILPKNNLNEFKKMMKIPFDKKIRKWIHALNSYEGIRGQDCRVHSLPQINFMVRCGKIWRNLALVADLSELWEVLEMLDIQHDEKKPLKRTAKDSPKDVYFKIKTEELADETLLMICNYVALDYCFFDFEPPKICTTVVSEICDSIA